MNQREIVRKEGGAIKTKAADVLSDLKGRGWRTGDFKNRWGSDDMERAVDGALQFHRRAKRIYHHTRIGWKPSGDLT